MGVRDGRIDSNLAVGLAVLFFLLIYIYGSESELLKIATRALWLFPQGWAQIKG